MLQSESKVANDLSSDESLSSQDKTIIDLQLDEIQDRVKFKRWLFYYIVGMSFMFAVVLLAVVVQI